MDGEDSAEGDSAPKRQSCFHSLRFVVLISAGMAMGIMQFLRSAITVAMVGMVNHTQLYINSHPNMTQDELEQLAEHARYESGEFDWNNELQEKIINCYMISYMLFQFPAAKLIATYGFRWGIAVSLALCAFFNTLTPIFAYWGWQWVIILRLAHGAAAAGFLPSMVIIAEKWSPKGRAARGYVLYQFIANIWMIIIPILGGYLASYHWKWAYYLPGVGSALFCVFWILVVSDDPKESKIISQQELDIILGECKENPDMASAEITDGKSVKLDIPFYYIFRLKEYYTLQCLWCLYWATSSLFFILLPLYIHRAFQVPVDQVGSIATIALCGSLISMLWPHEATDFIINRFKLSLTISRKIVVFICVLVANLTMGWLAYSHSNIIIAININRVFHMALDILFASTVMSQFGQYGLSGLVMSIVNSVSCLTGIAFCVLVGKFLDETGDTLKCWSWIFVTVIIMNSLYLLVHTLFCHSRPIAMERLKEKCVEVRER